MVAPWRVVALTVFQSEPLQLREASLGQGYVAAFCPASGAYALWANVSFLMTYTIVSGSGTVALPWTSGTSTQTASGDTASAWTIGLSANTTQACLNATATGNGTSTVNWLFVFNTLDLG